MGGPVSANVATIVQSNPIRMPISLGGPVCAIQAGTIEMYPPTKNPYTTLNPIKAEIVPSGIQNANREMAVPAAETIRTLNL